MKKIIYFIIGLVSICGCSDGTVNKETIKEQKDSVVSKRVHLKDLEFHCYGDSKEDYQKDWDEINKLLEEHYTWCNSQAYICHFFCNNDTVLYNQIIGETLTPEQSRQFVDWMGGSMDSYFSNEN